MKSIHLAARKTGDWIKAHPLETGGLLGIFILAAFLRFFRLAGYLPFGGDEGRDALVVYDFLVAHHPPGLGPGTSVGTMHLGPFYYYLMAIPMTIDWLNPVAAAAGVGILSLGSLGLLYYLTRRWFGVPAAIVAASLYAVSSVIVSFARASINAHPAPFFALLAVFGLDCLKRTGNFRWLILVGFAGGAIIQMHLLAALFLLVIGVATIYLWRTVRKPRYIWQGIIGGLIAFVATLLPFLWYELTHRFENTRALADFLIGGGPATASGSYLGRLGDILTDHLIGNPLAGRITWLAVLLTVIVLGVLGWGLARAKDRWPYVLLGSWLMLGVVGVALVRQPIGTHYVEFINPVPFILLGAGTGWLLARRQFRVIILPAIIIGTIGLGWLSLRREPFVSTPPINDYQRHLAVADWIADRATAGRFHFIEAASQYDSAYWFVLTRADRAPATFDHPQPTLMLVCDVPRPCDSTTDPRLAGWNLVQSEAVSGVTIMEFSRS